MLIGTDYLLPSRMRKKYLDTKKTTINLLKILDYKLPAKHKSVQIIVWESPIMEQKQRNMNNKRLHAII